MYPWIYDEQEDAKKSAEFFSFEEFLNYKPLKIYELSQTIIDQWHAQCSQFLKRVEKPAGIKDMD